MKIINNLNIDLLTTQVMNVDPKMGKVLRIVKIPVENISSVAFGGSLRNILYVITSSHDLIATRSESLLGHCIRDKKLRSLWESRECVSDEPVKQVKGNSLKHICVYGKTFFIL